MPVDPRDIYNSQNNSLTDEEKKSKKELKQKCKDEEKIKQLENKLALEFSKKSKIMQNFVNVLDLCTIFNINKVNFARDELNTIFRKKYKTSIETTYAKLIELQDVRHNLLHNFDVQIIAYKMYRYTYTSSLPVLEEFCHNNFISQDTVKEISKIDKALEEAIYMMEFKTTSAIIDFVGEKLRNLLDIEELYGTNNFISINTLAVDLKIASRKIEELSEKSPYLKSLLYLLNDATVSYLERNGMIDKINSSFAKEKLKAQFWNVEENNIDQSINVIFDEEI
jgi:hypothetical protein